MSCREVQPREWRFRQNGAEAAGTHFCQILVRQKCPCRDSHDQEAARGHGLHRTAEKQPVAIMESVESAAHDDAVVLADVVIHWLCYNGRQGTNSTAYSYA